MGRTNKIDWCDSTWNPVTGCNHGCEYCYARRQALRYGGFDFDPVGESIVKRSCDGADIFELEHQLSRIDKKGNACVAPYPYWFTPTFHRYRLDIPQRWKKPRTIFVGSMCDLFGAWVPDEWIREVFEACEAAPQHRYLFLTKNPSRFGLINGWNGRYNNEYAKDYMWFGTTITRQNELDRIRNLPYGDAHTFLSIEPILERIDLDRYLPDHDTEWRCSYCGRYAHVYSSHCAFCDRIGGYSGSFRKQPVNWIIVGAETGNRKDKIIPKREWIEHIVQICDASGIPIFMKESLRSIMGDGFRQEFPWEV